jgi:hypothetical protein
MNKLLTLKLEALKEFQTLYPTSHVGGSIGLMLRGVNLKRDLTSSDLDITIDEFDIQLDNQGLEPRSDSNDFDFSLKKNHESGHYTKIDIRISTEPSFDVVKYKGVEYNVSKIRDIIFWKSKYAKKGVTKHIYDIIVMAGGNRPLVQFDNTNDNDKLPF